MLKSICTLAVVFVFFTLSAQQHEWGVELRGKYGFLVAHRAIMSHLPKDPTQSFELNAFLQTKGKKSWQQALKMPVIGLSVLGTNVGNNEILGNHYGTYAFMLYPFAKNEKHFFYGRIGCGIGFTKTVFNQQTNPKNNAIGSHVNALINFGLLYKYKWASNHLLIGADLTHFSNGASRLPNLGLNLPYFSFGYGRLIRKTEQPEMSARSVFEKEWRFSLSFFGSIRDSYPTGKKRTGVWALNFNTQRIFTHGVGFEAGLDLMYKPVIQSYRPYIDKSVETMVQVGLYGAYLLSMDKLQIVVGMGLYTRDEYNPDDRVYHRVGFRYHLNDNWKLNITLKSHWAKADYIEYGFGYRF